MKKRKTVLQKKITASKITNYRKKSKAAEQAIQIGTHHCGFGKEIKAIDLELEINYEATIAQENFLKDIIRRKSYSKRKCWPGRSSRVINGIRSLKMFEHFFSVLIVGKRFRCLEPFPEEQSYVEDCEVCCRPIHLSYFYHNELDYFTAQLSDEDQ